MTDAFNASGDFSPENSVADLSFDNAPADFSTQDNFVAPQDDATPEAPEAPNGFVKLGLAAELVLAVKELGFTEPTAVQMATIPKALPGEGTQGEAKRFIDLMVSSQTGSGKTAAFLLPVLHTLLKQQADAEAQVRAEWDRTVAEAAAKGEAPPKRPKRKDPTSSRNFKAATPGALIVCRPVNWPNKLPMTRLIWCAIAVVCALPTWWAACLTSCKLPSCKMLTSWSRPQAVCWTCNARNNSSSTR
jgi:hypothetical protein